MLMKQARFFFSALFALLTIALSAQNVTVNGQIVDESTGEGVPFASVVVKGTMNGTSSDADGVYTISVQSNGTLVFSAVGYTTQEIAVKGSTLNVKLSPDSEFLEGTVVVGYGSAKKVSSLVGSIQTVNSQTLKNAPSSSALDQLQGQVAGLSVLTSSGIAGENNVSMTLHGVGTIGNGSNTPLYVIDGIPSTSRAIMAMNPNDIESVSVLKDASATSIYGSRASNGVIYITTKNGAYNETGSVTVRSQYGVSTIANTTLYENMMSGAELKDFWVRSGLHTAEWIDKTYTSNGYDANSEWYKVSMDLLNPQYQNDINISGGGKKVAYMISASQFHQKGYTPGNYYDRYTVRSNVQGHPLNWLKFGTNINLSIDEQQSNGNWGGAGSNSNYTSGGLSYLLNPLFPTKDKDGNTFPERFPGSNFMNPTFYMKNHPDAYSRYGLNGTAYVEITPVKNLKFVSRAGLDGYFRLNDWATNPSYTAVYGGTATVGKSSALDYSATITNTAEYSFEINHNNKFSVLVGQEGVSEDYVYFYGTSKGHTDDRHLLLQQGMQSTYALSESNSQSRFLSFFAHADYTLLDRYYFDAVVRNDAVSRFGADNRNAQFWSAGARWNVKKESFMKNVRFFDSLDFKLSYGTQGNASLGSNYPALGIIGASGTYAEEAGFTLTQPANTKLTWEKQGLFTASLSGRVMNFLDFTFEYYDRRTSSMLMDVPNPYSTGFTSTSQNVGTLSNKGVDITLGLDLYRTRDAYLRVNTTFNYNNQKILSLFDGRDRWDIANTGISYVVGQPVSFYYPIYAGLDPEDGQMMWYVPGENPDVTTMEETTKFFDETGLLQNTGKRRYAPINGGFSFSGGWKGLSFQADFSYVLGKYMVNNDGYFYMNPANFATMNTNKVVSDFWTPDNKDAKFPNWSTGAIMQFDTHLLENASFIRLKNLQLGYNLPKSALNWTSGVLNGVKLTLTGRNLLTGTKYSGTDPEANTNLTMGKAGNTKQVLAGLEITF